MKSFIYFYRTFWSTGIQNVLPQLFILGNESLRSSELLPVCLLLASLSSIAGIAFSKRLSGLFHAMRPAARTAAGIGLAALTGAGLAAMFLAEVWAVFLSAAAVVSGLLELSFNMLDHRYVDRLTEPEVRAHARSVTIVQLVAVTAAPFYFAFTAELLWLQLLLAATGSVMLAVVMLRFGEPMKEENTPASAQVSKRTSAASSRLHVRDLAFLVYALAVYAAVFIFSAHLIFILHDYYGMEGASWKGGLLLGIGNLVAVGAVLGFNRMRSFSGGHAKLKGNAAGSTGMPIVAHVSVSASLLASSVLLYGKWWSSFAFILLLACLVGGAFGIFQLLSREYASQRAAGDGAGIVLTIYNNLKNIASLAGFGTALLLASASSRMHADYVGLVMAAVIACMAAACAMLVVIALQLKRREEGKH